MKLLASVIFLFLFLYLLCSLKGKKNRNKYLMEKASHYRKSTNDILSARSSHREGI